MRNVLLGILLNISLLIVMFTLTVLNKNFANYVEKTNDIVIVDTKEYNDLIKNKTSIYIATFMVIFLTGEVFLFTRSKHDIYEVFINSFLISILIYGLLYVGLNEKNIIYYSVMKSYLHFYLGVEIVLFEISIYKKYLLKKILK